MNIDELLKGRREEVVRVAAERGANNVRVFGSVARGEADETSDIDLLVAFDDTVSLLGHAGLVVELQELLGRQVDVISDETLRPSVRERILDEAVPL